MGLWVVAVVVDVVVGLVVVDAVVVVGLVVVDGSVLMVVVGRVVVVFGVGDV